MKTIFAGFAVALAASTMAASAQVAVYGETRATVFERSATTGLVRGLGNEGDAPVAIAGPGTAGLSPEAAAVGFLSANRGLFGLAGPAVNVTANRTLDAGDDRSMVRVQQSYNGLPILGAELNVQLDASRNVISVTGKSVGDLSVDITPAVSAADARLVAIKSVARRYQLSPLLLSATAPDLVIHDPRLIGGPIQPAHATWKIVVTSAERMDVQEVVLVDSETGRVSVQFNNRPDASAPASAKQLICDANGKTAKVPCSSSNDIAKPGSSSVKDVKNAFRFAEQTYDFYARRFNRNSLDGKGLKLVSTVRFYDSSCDDVSCPDHKFPNAFWNGSQMVYGEDYANADDVVAHELSHGFTSFTSNLNYFMQSGAINEALSDIFGEYLDQSNGVDGAGGSVKWAMGEDLPIGAIRNMANPTKFNDPDRMRSNLYTADPSGNDRGGVHTNSGVANKAAYLMAAKGTRKFNGQTITGIGIDKAAAIWFRVNTLYLNSGSDYADLGIALNSACKDLIGKTPKTQAGKPSPSGKFTKANCAQVAKAVLATEMAKPPKVNAIPAEAKVCTSGSPSNTLFERFEGSTFKFNQTGSAHWGLISDYAASNKRSIMGYNAGLTGSDKRFDSQLNQIAAVKIPGNGFLRFAHYYNLYTDVSGSEAGGVVEYKLEGTDNWVRVPPSMFAENPYNSTLIKGAGNVIEGSKAFSGFSAGWTSSRINLQSLAGKNVRFRFRLATGFNGAWDSWIIDDIRIYGCK